MKFNTYKIKIIDLYIDFLNKHTFFENDLELFIFNIKRYEI